jgi:UTP--glucose-1-phosphate uridylyltransferase
MIRKCLFPVAGYGTRFLPATKAIPKEMLPILTKPLIQYGVEEAAEAGCVTMAMVTSKYKKAIEDHFDTHIDIETSIADSSKEKLLEGVNDLMDVCQFSYTRQQEMKGLGHAILTGESLIGCEPFAVILPDDLCVGEDVGVGFRGQDVGVGFRGQGVGDGVLMQMMEIHAQYPEHCIVAVEKIPKEDSNKYGVIDGKHIDASLIQVNNMVEKPDPAEAPSDLAIIGRYILTPEIFDVLRTTPPGKGGEIQITDALLTLAKQGKVLAYRFEGRRFDCGSVDGFVEATNFFYKKFRG